MPEPQSLDCARATATRLMKTYLYAPYGAEKYYKNIRCYGDEVAWALAALVPPVDASDPKIAKRITQAIAWAYDLVQPPCSPQRVQARELFASLLAATSNPDCKDIYERALASL